MCGRPSPPDRPTPQQTPQPTQTPAQQQQQQPLSPTTDDVSNPPALSTPTTATETANAATPATAVASTPVGKGGDVTPHPLIPATPATPEVHSATNDYAVIPRQNKDVCRECDKATWRHTCTGCFFKWCKGCKRFRNLIAFKGKLQASKCDYCRARGRLGYMRRKCDGNDDEAARQHPETPLETGGPSEENRPPEQQLTTATESGAAAATVAVAVALTAAAAPAVPVPSASLAAAPVPTPTDVNMASTE